MSKAWAGGSTRAWRRIRAYVLDRDGHRCRAHSEGWCSAPGVPGHRCTGTATTAHHTRGREITGDDPRFIVAACGSCNAAIGDPTGQADPRGRGVTVW